MRPTAAGGGRPWVVMAGGGTAGHVTPALAIAGALVDAGHDPRSIHFVGSRRGIEGRLVPAAGFPVTLLPGRGLVRRADRANLVAAAGLLGATAMAIVLVGRWRPGAVVSVGGYAAAPAVAAALVWRVPVVLAEANAVPGAVNRLAGRFAAAAAVAFPGTPLPRAVVTGNPIRPAMAAIERSPQARREARVALGYPEGVRLVAVAGGSLGAGRLNEAVLDLARGWADRGDLAVHHVVGERNADGLARRRPRLPPGGLTYRQVAFEERMDLLYAAADVTVQRAGASTVAELAAAGIPSVLVPLPRSPGGHQERNAAALAAAGGAVVVDDAALDGDRLMSVLDGLLGDPGLLERMGAASRALAVPDAAARVAALVETHARRPR